jgi:hypothetical protein
MSVGQPGERRVQLHIRLGKRSDHAWRNVAGGLDQRGEAQIGHVFGIQERLIDDEARSLTDENHFAARLGEGLKSFETRPRDHRRRGHDDGPVDLAAEILKAAALDRR